MSMKKVPESEYPKSKLGTKPDAKSWMKTYGAIWSDPDRGNNLYLRWGAFGKDFTKSLETTALSVAMDRASGVRKAREEEFLAAQGKTVETEESKGIPIYDELYRTMNPGKGESGYPGYYETFYPIGKTEDGRELTNLNTRYDTEKLLNLFFGSLANRLGRDFWIKPKPKKGEAGSENNISKAPLTLDDLKADYLEAAYLNIKRTHSIKVQQKVTVALRKFINWEVSKGRIPDTKDLLNIISDKTPKSGEIINQRESKLEDEVWTEEEFQAVYQACKSGHSCSRPLDTEIYWIMRYMGLPPADIYQMTSAHFDRGITWFKKDRAKRKRGGAGTYEQPMIKSEPGTAGYDIDLQTIRIIKERIAATKKGDRLFNQPQSVTRYRNDRQDDQTRWVSNFSGRRTALQESLDLSCKGAKGLRTTFISEWVKAGCPEITLEVWVGHVAGSTMLRKFYSDRKTRATWRATAPIAV